MTQMDKIVVIGSPGSNVLREKSAYVNFRENTRALTNAMIRIAEAATDPHALGLAAVQVGVKKRVLIMRENVGQPWIVMINPAIIGRSTEMVGSIEGCMSIPGEHYIVRRWARVHVAYRTYGSEMEKRIVSGLTSFIVQHEIDHLDGILISDHGVRFEPPKDQDEGTAQAEQAFAKAQSRDYGLK